MLKFSDEVFEAMQRLLRAQRELSQTMLGGGNGLLAERTEDVAGGGGDRSQPGGAEQQDESSDVTGAAGIDEDVALQEPGQDVMEPDETRRDEAEDLVAEPDDSTDEDEALTDEAEDTTDEDEDLTDEYDDDLDEDSDDYRDSHDNYSQSDVYAPDTGAAEVEREDEPPAPSARKGRQPASGRRCRPAVPLPLADLEGHALTLLQRPVTAALDRGEVDETSLRPPSGVMKPKPFSPLNHFTVPSGMFPPGG
jgi:hypothetical protein